MNAEMLELARRAVACEGWRWMEGMLAARHKGGVVDMTSSHRIDHMSIAVMDSIGWLPILDEDPAAAGCLLHLVREAWGDPKIFMSAHMSFWMPSRPFGVLMNSGAPTEIETLVAALEAGSK